MEQRVESLDGVSAPVVERPAEDVGVLRSLPRRPRVSGDMRAFRAPMMVSTKFDAPVYKVLARSYLWVYASLRFFAGNIADWLRGQGTVERRAARLRRTLEDLGGTVVKLGQQMSMRLDLITLPYCEELGKMLDRMPAFPTAEAVEAIERVTGKSLGETFSAFDPVPVGSASIACVYQAVLTTGEKVAVKVRRPGIGELFAADLRALDGVGRFLEFLTILRPGFTYNLRQGLRQILMEEMDFRREGRYQELFRRRAKKMKTRFLKAPPVYFELSSDDVLVMAFVAGVMLSEVLTAVEQKTPEAVNLMAGLNIDPKLVARRLLWANHAAMISDLFFHADPSPANIVVQRNSKLVFIDFGSCGSFTQSQRRALKQINYCQKLGDAEGMALASLAVLEPLPPIDIDGFTKELEALYRTSIYAMKSRHAQWWERTSASQWLSFMKVSMAYMVPMPLGIVHTIRATLLYDTLAVRLDKDIVFYREFRRYEKFAGKRARRRFQKTLRRGLAPKYFLQLEQATDAGNRLFFRLQRFAGLSPFRYLSMVRKATFALLAIVRLIGVNGVIVGIWALVLAAMRAFERRPVVLREVLEQVSSNLWFWMLISFVTLLDIRGILVRLRDRDVDRDV